MNDEVDKSAMSDSAATDADENEPRAGERLAIARREQQIAVSEIAKELHLDEPKVRALEQNNFEMLGAPVFAKGHLRKYAMLVGVDIDDVLQDYYQLNRASGMPPVVGKVRKQARDISPGPWIAVIVVLLLAAITYYLFTTQDVASNILSPQAPSEEPANIADEVDSSIDSSIDAAFAAAVVELPPSNTAPEPVAAPPLDTTAQNTQPLAAPVVQLAAGEVRLRVDYTGDSWTEITDANGRQLFFDLGHAGRSVEISGQAPLSVLFGNADNVSLSVNGQDRAISAADRRGETARLTINSP